jgi:hypothetical protein
MKPSLSVNEAELAQVQPCIKLTRTGGARQSPHLQFRSSHNNLNQ